MQNFFEKFQAMPKELQKEVIDFAEFLEKKNKEKPKTEKSDRKIDFSGWAGCLADMKEEYTSLELQKKALDWR